MAIARGTLWDRLPLRYKGALIVGAPIVALLLTALTSLWFDRQNDRTEALVNEARDAHALVDHVRHEVEAVASSLQRYTLTEDSDDLPHVDGRLIAALRSLARLRHPVTKEPYAGVVPTAASLREVVLTADALAAEASRQDEPVERQEDALDFMSERIVALGDVLEVPAAESQRAVTTLALELAAFEEREETADAITLLVGLFGGLAAAAFFARNFTTRISALGTAAEHLAAGDFSRPFPAGSDEIGELAERVHAAFSGLKKAEAERERRAARMAGIIQTMSDMASADLDVRLLHELLLERAVSLTGADGAAVQIEHEGALTVVAGVGPVSAHVGRTLDIARSMAGRTLRTGEAFVTRDILVEKDVDLGLARDIGTRSAITIPLADAGVVVGVLAVHSAEVGAFGAAEVTDLELLGGFFGAVISKVQAHVAREVVVRERTDALEELRLLHDELAAKNGALVTATEEANAANHAKSEFLSRMSHELRTPLNAILGFAQLLQADPLDDDEADSVCHIEKAGRHLLSLIDEVLEIARIEAGTTSVQLRPVALADVVSESVDLIRPLAAKRGITVTFADEGSDGEALADARKVKQILLNLLSNAVKYNHVGGSVGVSIARSDAALSVSVADTGPGIPAENLPLLFTPFDRLGAEHSAVEGTGLGLAVSKQLAGAMQGELSFNTTQGSGSVFTLHLLRSEPGLPLPPHGTPPASGGSPARFRPRPAVVYVEDNPSNARLVERALRANDVDLHVATTASAGIDLVNSVRPTLVLLDMNLPDASGIAVLDALRGAAPSLPVVAVSADATPGARDAALAAGALHYLTKPLDLRELAAVVDRWGAVREGASL